MILIENDRFCGFAFTFIGKKGFVGVKIVKILFLFVCFVVVVFCFCFFVYFLYVIEILCNFDLTMIFYQDFFCYI